MKSLIEYNVIHVRSFCPIIDFFLGHIILIIVPNCLARIDVHILQNQGYRLSGFFATGVRKKNLSVIDQSLYQPYKH